MAVKLAERTKIKLGHIVKFPTIEENTKDNYRLFNGYGETKELDLKFFSDKMDPVHTLFSFYSLILMLTALIAVIVFLTIVIFGKISVFGFFMIIIPVGIICNGSFFKKGTNKGTLY
ncbi:MAG: hypothetical protein ABIH00_07060 [Armatimonadota bacterium]